MRRFRTRQQKSVSNELFVSLRSLILIANFELNLIHATAEIRLHPTGDYANGGMPNKGWLKYHNILIKLCETNRKLLALSCAFKGRFDFMTIAGKIS